MNATSLLATSILLASAAVPCWAQSASAPFAVQAVAADGTQTATTIEPAPPSSKKYKLCVLIPHMKDSYFAAVDYGLVEEARRVGVAATILQAGGYDNLPKQVSQFDDCLTSGADAILVAPISEAGLSAKFAEAAEKKIPVVVFINPVADAPVTSKVFVDFESKGRQTGLYLKEKMASGGNVAAFPGPQGSGWAESYLKGFNEALAGSNLTIVDTKFGDAGVAEQLRLVEDSLQGNPDIDAIWGTAPTAEAAIGAVSDAGLPDTIIMASYENQAMLKAMESGKILGFGTEFPVMQGRAAVDLAVRSLDGETVGPHYLVVPKMVTKETLSSIDVSQVLAPDGFQPVFSVE